MVKQMVEANGVELCAETVGDPAHPPLLLIMGTGASMLWWEEGFCQLLADGGRFVIRYDHRDTGRSVTYELQRPGYSGADLVADAAGVLDAFGIPSAHLVGVSAGGAFAQLLALGRPNRVLSLILISTSPALPGERELPPPTVAFGRFVSTAAVDWTDAESVIDYLVDYSRVLAGERRPFDEAPDTTAGASRRRARPRLCSRAEPRRATGGQGLKRDLVLDHRANLGHPRHRRPDVPDGARQSAGGGDPRSEAAPVGGCWARCLSGRLGTDRRCHPRAHCRER
jgi:pimeloyl-ACP methyl ester carboxylesterase